VILCGRLGWLPKADSYQLGPDIQFYNQTRLRLRNKTADRRCILPMTLQETAVFIHINIPREMAGAGGGEPRANGGKHAKSLKRRMHFQGRCGRHRHDRFRHRQHLQRRALTILCSTPVGIFDVLLIQINARPRYPGLQIIPANQFKPMGVSDPQKPRNGPSQPSGPNEANEEAG
jgi:hypothetical protein